MSHIIIENVHYKKIIPLNDKYVFTFLEDSDIKLQHPLSNYYLKLDDLSINLLISLKWIEWGYFFLTSLSTELDGIKEDYSLNNIISKSIQKQNDQNESKKILILDDRLIEDRKALDNALKDIYCNNILGPLFDENTKVHMKLKINLREFLIISHIAFPTLMKVIKND